jgi:hypothetical protein
MLRPMQLYDLLTARRDHIALTTGGRDSSYAALADVLPLNVNGKLDRPALLARLQEPLASAGCRNA